MGVTIGDVDAFVPDALGDGDGGKAHFDEQRNVRVPQIVDADAFNACGFCAPVHLMVQICLGDGEDAVVRFQPIQRLGVILHFIHEKLRDFDRSVALGRLGRRDDDIALDVLKGFADGQRLPLEVEIRSGQRQQLSQPDAAPVQHLEGIVGSGLVHHHFGEFQIFVLCPEQHLLV